MSTNADRQTWTCRVRTAGGRLPDVRHAAEHVGAMGQGATLRGIEVTARGSLRRRNGALFLRLARTGETVRLLPLTQKVQWDVPRAARALPTEAERGAYLRLLRAHPAPGGSLLVAGPLVPTPDGQALEVREWTQAR